MPTKSKPWEGWASTAAGVLWLLLWLHQRLTHGSTTVNEMRRLFGLTWMDSGKFLVIPLLLLFLVFLQLYRRRRHTGWSAQAGGFLTSGSLAVMIVGAAMQFWTFPWGSYTQGFTATLPRYGGPLQAMASLVLTLGLIIFHYDLVRAKITSLWLAPIVVIGGLTTFFLTPAMWMPGVAWLLFGFMLWQRTRLREDEHGMERP